MASKAFSTVQALLPELSSEEKGLLIALLKQQGAVAKDNEVQGSGNQRRQRSVDTLADLLLDQAENTLIDAGIAVGRVRASYLPSRDKQSLAKAARSLKVLLEESSLFNQANFQRLAKLAGVVVVDYLQNARVPVTLRTLLEGYIKTASLVDHAYPGYLQSGLLDVLLERGSPKILPPGGKGKF